MRVRIISADTDMQLQQSVNKEIAMIESQEKITGDGYIYSGAVTDVKVNYCDEFFCAVITYDFIKQ